jgi:hypothetical protein
MNIEQIEKLQACADVLGQMSENFARMPSENINALQFGLQCTAVQSLVVEYAAHLAAGMEPFDALQATVNGELKIPESKAVVLSVLTAKPNH